MYIEKQVSLKELMQFFINDINVWLKYITDLTTKHNLLLDTYGILGDNV